MKNSMFFVLKPSRFVFMCLALSLSVSACSLPEPGRFSTNKVQLEEEKVVHEVMAADFDGDVVGALAHHYGKHGDGPVNLVVTYNPKSRSNSAMMASGKAADVTGMFRRAGVRDVRSKLLPVVSSAESKVIVSYIGYNALAPKDCELMSGIQGRTVDVDEDYKLGCSVDTLFARQISRPKDLLGQETSSTSDGRRAANQIDAYRTGVPNEPLEGESASGE